MVPKEASMKQAAILTIIWRDSGSISYLLHDSTGVLVWNTRAYSTDEGKAGARQRLRVWPRHTRIAWCSHPSRRLRDGTSGTMELHQAQASPCCRGNTVHVAEETARPRLIWHAKHS